MSIQEWAKEFTAKGREEDDQYILEQLNKERELVRGKLAELINLEDHQVTNLPGAIGVDGLVFKVEWVDGNCYLRLCGECPKCGREISTFFIYDKTTLAAHIVDPGWRFHDCPADKPLPMVTEEDIRVAYKCLIDARSELWEATTDAITARAELEDTRMSVIAAGGMVGKNEAEREAYFRANHIELYQDLAEREEAERQAKNHFDIHQMRVEQVRALLRLAEITSQPTEEK